MVSKPTPIKMTGRSGFCSAMSSASSGEYTMRISCPVAFCAESEVDDPGTRIMSPKVKVSVSMKSASTRQE